VNPWLSENQIPGYKTNPRFSNSFEKNSNIHPNPLVFGQFFHETWQLFEAFEIPRTSGSLNPMLFFQIPRPGGSLISKIFT